MSKNCLLRDFGYLCRSFDILIPHVKFFYKSWDQGPISPQELEAGAQGHPKLIVQYITQLTYNTVHYNLTYNEPSPARKAGRVVLSL